MREPFHRTIIGAPTPYCEAADARSFKFHGRAAASDGALKPAIDLAPTIEDVFTP